MPRLTRFLLRHKLAVVAAWLVVLVAGVAAAGVVPGRLSQEFSFPGEEGYEANVAILEAYGTGGPGNPLVPVVELARGTTVGSPAARDALERAFAEVAADPRLRVLAWPATTGDRRLVVEGGRTMPTGSSGDPSRAARAATRPWARRSPTGCGAPYPGGHDCPGDRPGHATDGRRRGAGRHRRAGRDAGRGLRRPARAGVRVRSSPWPWCRC